MKTYDRCITVSCSVSLEELFDIMKESHGKDQVVEALALLLWQSDLNGKVKDLFSKWDAENGK